VAAGLVAAAVGCTGQDPVDPAGAVVGVRSVACGEPVRGVGVVVGDDRVLTNAHVVAGADEIEIGGRDGRLVSFDPNRDLALVAVADLGRPAVGLGTVDAGDEGTLVAVDAGAKTVRHRFEVRRRIRAIGADIYRADGADRRALEVEMEFAPGWSGSGLFDERGRLVGLAFAESRGRRGVAYAVAASEIEGFLASAGDDEVGPGPCR
jgi:S1-C subfamily serine protease